MTRLNNFGAVNGDVIAMYPNTAAADFGGTTVVDAALGRAARVFAMSLSPDVWRQMRLVDAQLVVRYATAGQTTATIGLKPIISGTVHLWQYPNEELFDPNNSFAGYANTAGWQRGWFYRKPRFGIMELDQTALAITVNLSTGAVANLPALNLGDRVYASYEVDTDAAAFAMPSIADAIVYGAAAEMGAFLYTEGTQEWKLVDEYRERWKAILGSAKDGTWVPDELRKLIYFQPVERGAEEISSVRLFRG